MSKNYVRGVGVYQDYRVSLVAENKDVLGGDTQVTVAKPEDGDIFALVYRENECLCISLNPHFENVDEDPAKQRRHPAARCLGYA
ncbi:hypothetical protein VKT23_000047 [Stygiomarasmius scandens]|uniref:Uncharacterized protein n=1 Tax=Marasmiellus scandens TaxID=2682957 RepID=A0ABR1K300_9AGAR